MGPKQGICAVGFASQQIIFAMRCIFIAICTLAAEIHCEIGHDAGITARQMPRCGDLWISAEPGDLILIAICDSNRES